MAEDILELFLKSGQERVFTRTMAAWLDKWGDRPWRAQMKRKGVTGQWLAQQLQQYGIRPKTLRIGEERAKGYEFEDFRDAFRRYIPRRDFEAFRKDILEQAQERQGGTPTGSGPVSHQS